MYSQDTVDRFNRKWTIDPETRCWIWEGSMNQNGYGQARVNGHAELAHRMSYRMHKGEIPPGQCVCHECDNRRCVNPEHLWAGSQSANLRDMVKKGKRSYVGVANPCTKVTEAQVRKVRELIATGMKQTKVAIATGIPYSTVSAIKLGRSWKHLT